MTTAGGLRNLEVRAVGLLREAEAVAADHDAVVEDDAVADDDALANRALRVDDAVVADARAGADRRRAGKDVVRAPIDAPAPTVTNGPIETSAPIVASGAIALSVSMPFAGADEGRNNATARAKSTYGFLLRSTAKRGARRNR